MKRLRLAAVALLGLALPAFAGTYEDGDAAYEAGNYEEAKSILAPLTEQSNAKAMNLIGLMHDYGQGYPKNAKTACDWYEKSANLGYVSAQNNLSICFESGSGRLRNIDRSIYWREQAGKQGNLLAQINLVRLYKDLNIEKAYSWGRKAVSQDSAYARASMWALDIHIDNAPTSPMDITCSLVMITWLDKPIDYYD